MDERAANPYKPPDAGSEPSPRASGSGGQAGLISIGVAAAVFGALRLLAWWAIPSTLPAGPWSDYLSFAHDANFSAGLLSAGAAILVFLHRKEGVIAFTVAAAGYAVWRTRTSLNLVASHVIVLPVWYIWLKSLWPFAFLALALLPAVRRELRAPRGRSLTRSILLAGGWMLVGLGLLALRPLLPAG